MMKKVAISGALLLLAGCAQVENYQDVVKHPAPAGPQSKLVSPEAIASLIVTAEGDTLDCRQWQRVIAVPGKLMLRGDSLDNVTRELDIYGIEREGNQLEYAGMTLKRVDRPTAECADALAKKPLPSVLP